MFVPGYKISYYLFSLFHRIAPPNTPAPLTPLTALHPQNSYTRTPIKQIPCTCTLGIFDLSSFIFHTASTPPHLHTLSILLLPLLPLLPQSILPTPSFSPPHAKSFSPPHTILLPSVGNRLSSFLVASPFFTVKYYWFFNISTVHVYIFILMHVYIFILIDFSCTFVLNLLWK